MQYKYEGAVFFSRFVTFRAWRSSWQCDSYVSKLGSLRPINSWVVWKHLVIEFPGTWEDHKCLNPKPSNLRYLCVCVQGNFTKSKYGSRYKFLWHLIFFVLLASEFQYYGGKTIKLGLSFCSWKVNLVCKPALLSKLCGTDPVRLLLSTHLQLPSISNRVLDFNSHDPT